MHCPLCHHSGLIDFLKTPMREYIQCSNCHLIFVPKKFHLSEIEEKKRYDCHQNDPKDENYRKFLSRLSTPLNKLLNPKSTGLDFGSGPNPTLSIMLEQYGHTMNIYDYYYEPAPQVLDKQYDFITSTEVIEHISNPEKILHHLWSRIKPNGYLGLMTKLALNLEKFEKWHYIRDETHICFYSTDTFKWLAKTLKAQMQILGDDVIIFKKAIN